MVKNTFTIEAKDDGTIVLSATPVFNKLESGVTKLAFTLPEMDGYKYLLARHDRKEWYAIPIDSENTIMMGQTVTRLHGRWAFNVCVSENLITDGGTAENVVYMSDVFEGLVYDNVSDHSQPSALEPNVLKIVNKSEEIYERFEAKFDDVENDLQQAATNLSLAQNAANSAASSAAAASDSATAAAASEADAKEHAEDAQTSLESAERAESAAIAQANIALNYRNLAEEAKTAAETAEAQAEADVIAAESWAVGGTGTRSDEDKNNSKYWAEVAKEAAESGGVSSFNGRKGPVEPEAGDYTAEMVGALPDSTTHLSGDVPVTRKVNDKELSSDITLAASDVGALPDSTTHLSGDVPVTRKVNDKELSADITLAASDVGAVSLDQGSGNKGKALIVGEDGNVTLGDAGPEIVTAWEETTSDEKVPSEKLVKDSLTELNSDIVAEQTAIENIVGDAYSSTKTYELGDCTIYNNVVYEAIQDSFSGVEPTDTSYWQTTSLNKLSQKGDYVLLGSISSATTSYVTFNVTNYKSVAIYVNGSSAATNVIGCIIMPISLWKDITEILIPANNSDRIILGTTSGNTDLKYTSGGYSNAKIYGII